MTKLSVTAPGKVNLVLDVLARRTDGYHDIRSLMITVGLADRLTVEDSASNAIELACDDPGTPTDGSNLVCRAAQLLRERAGVERGCRIWLEKRIPVGGGMGGGSSDAAAILNALNRLWGLGFTMGELAAMGATIGADIPFFFHAPSAIVAGVGNEVVPVRMKWTGWIALVTSGVHVSTKAVYARCRPKGSARRGREVGELPSIETAGGLRAHLRNELEEAVFACAPVVGEMHAALEAETGRRMCVSGAGSVVFDLFDTREEADRLVERARACRHVQRAMAVEAPSG